MHSIKLVAVACAALLAGCTERAPQVEETTTQAPAVPTVTPPSVPVPTAVPWAFAPASFFAVANDRGDTALVINAPETSALPLAAELFARSGVAGSAQFQPLSGGEACTVGPRASVAAAREWGVAFPAGVATAVPLDSIDGLRSRDSLALAVAVTRLVARVPGDTIDALRGLPYVVRSAWTFATRDDRVALIAIAVRTLGLEADPRSEQTFIIAERAAAAKEWVASFGERRTAPEADLDTDDVLAVVTLQTHDDVDLFVERAGNDGAQVLVYARTTGGWTRRWASERAACLARR